MAAGILPEPGTPYLCALGLNGEYLCGHPSCAETYGMANERCSYCGERVGYDRRFYREYGKTVHALCAEEAAEG